MGVPRSKPGGAFAMKALRSDLSESLVDTFEQASIEKGRLISPWFDWEDSTGAPVTGMSATVLITAAPLA